MQHTVYPPCGPILGFHDDIVMRYTGVPYATASRFEAPRPAADWKTTLSATGPSAACPQPFDQGSVFISRVDMLQNLPISENCHHLSVTVPEDAKPDDNLPVMVWVHGGAFKTGAGDSPAYNPSQLVFEHRIIVVSINYRLSLFGFLGDGDTKPANLGLLDQLEALRWVRRNIAAFGGTDDPKSITFFGESAGGTSVADMMAVPEAAQLFGRAIVQSAPLGISRGRDALNSVLLKASASATVSLSPDELVALCEQIEKAGSSKFPAGAMPFAPQFGHAPLPAEGDLDAALDENASKIDLLVGSNDHEASLMVGFLPVSTLINAPLVGKWVHDYAVRKLNRMLFHPGDRDFADSHARAGGKASLYRFHLHNKSNRFGATHTMELALLFPNAGVYKGVKILEGFSTRDLDMAGRQMRKIWADFAKGRQVDEEDCVNELITIKRIWSNKRLGLDA